MEVNVHIFILVLYCLLHPELVNSDTHIVPDVPVRTSIGGIHATGGADRLLHASFPSEADTLAYVDALKHSNFSQWRSLEEVAKRAGGGSCSGAVNTSVLTALYLLGLFNLCSASPASCCIPPQADRRRRRSFVPEHSEENAELPQLIDSLKLNLSSLSLEQFGNLPHVSSPDGGRIPVHISVVDQVRKLWDSNPRLLSNIHCRTATEAVRSSFISLSGVASGIILAYSIAQLNQCYPQQLQKEHYQNIWFFPIPRHTRLLNQQKVRSLPPEMPVKGEDDPDDGCDRTSVPMENVGCAKVFSIEVCPYMSWVLLNRETGKGECVPRICLSGKVFVADDQMCHDVNEPGFCPERQRLYLTAWGEAVCDCIDGTFYGPDGKCHRLYEQAYCYKGTVLQFHKPSKTLVCKADSCQNLNSNLLDGDLPYAKDEEGVCHQFSTVGPCEIDQRFGFDVEALKPACVSLEQAGIAQPPKSYQYSHMSFPSSAGASVPHYEVSYVILNGSTWELMMRTVGREKRDARNLERKVIPFLDTREFPTNMEEILPGLEELGIVEGIKHQIKSNSGKKGILEEESVKSQDSLNSTGINLEKDDQEIQRQDIVEISKIERKPKLSMNSKKKLQRRRQTKEKSKRGKKRKRKSKNSLKKTYDGSVKNWKAKRHRKDRRNSTASEHVQALSKLQSNFEEFSSNYIIGNKTEDEQHSPNHHHNSNQTSDGGHYPKIGISLVPASKENANFFIKERNKIAEVYYIKNDANENSGQTMGNNEIYTDKGFTNLEQIPLKIPKNKTEIPPHTFYSLPNKPEDLSHSESMDDKNQENDLYQDNTYQVISFSNITYDDSVTTEPFIDDHGTNVSALNGSNLLEQLIQEDENVQLTNLSETVYLQSHLSELNKNIINEYTMTPFDTKEDIIIGSLNKMNFFKNNGSDNDEHTSFILNVNVSDISPLAHKLIPKENHIELVQVLTINEEDTTNLQNVSQVYRVNASVNDSFKTSGSDFIPNKDNSSHAAEVVDEYLRKIPDVPDPNSINKSTKKHTLKSFSHISSLDIVGNVKYCNTSEIDILKRVTGMLEDNFVLQQSVSAKQDSIPSLSLINAKSINVSTGELSPVIEYTDIKATPIISSGLQLYFNKDNSNNEETINKEDNRIHLIVEKRLEQISQESEMKQKSKERDLHKFNGIIKVHQTDLKPQLTVSTTVIPNRSTTMRTTKKKNERGKKQEHGAKNAGKGKRGRKPKKTEKRKKNEVLQIIKEEINETSGDDNSDKSPVTTFPNSTLEVNKSTKKGNIEEDSLPDYLRNRDRRQAGSKRVRKTFPGIINAPLLNQCRPGAKRDYNGHCRAKVIPENDVPAPRRAKELPTQPSLPRIKCEGTSRLDARGICRTTFSGLG